MRSSSLSVHPPSSPPSSHQSSSYSTPSASYFTNPSSASYPPPYFSSSASSLERLPSSTSYPQSHYRPSQTTVAARPAPTLTVTSPSPYQDLLGIKALPQLYERIKRLGWIHQNMVMFLMQRQVFNKEAYLISVSSELLDNIVRIFKNLIFPSFVMLLFKVV